MIILSEYDNQRTSQDLQWRMYYKEASNGKNVPTAWMNLAVRNIPLLAFHTGYLYTLFSLVLDSWARIWRIPQPAEPVFEQFTGLLFMWPSLACLLSILK